MPIGLNSDGSSRVSVNDNQEIDLITNSQPRFRVEATGQIKAVYESEVGTDYNTTLRNGYFCRAWVNFNGSGTISIRASGNISSIADNGQSDYIPNFTVAMPDVNYAITSVGYHESGVTEGPIAFFQDTQTVNTFRIQFRGNSGSPDPKTIMIAVFR